MSLLERIDGPDDLQALRPDQLPALAEEIRRFLVDKVSPHRRPPRPQPRRRRAHHRPAPGLRLAARHGRLRHRPPVLRAQAAHRPAGLRRAAQRRAACPATRAGPSPSTTSSRTRHASTVAVLGRRPRQGLRAARRARPAHVVAVIGDGALTGGMAWEALNNIAAGQGPPLVIVVNDNGAPTPRPSAASPTTSPRCAPPAATSSSSTGASTRCDAHARRRRRDVRGAARREEGHQGRRRPAGHVRGPRPEVRRPGRRPRRAGRRDGAAPGASASAAR